MGRCSEIQRKIVRPLCGDHLPIVAWSNPLERGKISTKGSEVSELQMIWINQYCIYIYILSNIYIYIYIIIYIWIICWFPADRASFFSSAITFVDFLDHPHRDGLSRFFCPNIPTPNWSFFKYGTV